MDYKDFQLKLEQFKPKKVTIPGLTYDNQEQWIGVFGVWMVVTIVAILWYLQTH